MARNDLHVSTEGECVKEVGPYFTAAGLLAHKRTQAIIIQVGVGWNARKGPSFFRAEGAYPYVNIWVYIHLSNRMRINVLINIHISDVHARVSLLCPCSGTGVGTWRGPWCGTCRLTAHRQVSTHCRTSLTVELHCRPSLQNFTVELTFAAELHCRTSL